MAKEKVGENGFKLIRHVARHPLGKHLVCGKIVSLCQVTVEFEHIKPEKIDNLMAGAIGQSLNIKPELTPVESLADMHFV